MTNHWYYGSTLFLLRVLLVPVVLFNLFDVWFLSHGVVIICAVVGGGGNKDNINISIYGFNNA